MTNILWQFISDTFNLVYYSFIQFIDFIFNQAYIIQGVSIGWIIVICSFFPLFFSAIIHSSALLFTAVDLSKGSDKHG